MIFNDDVVNWAKNYEGEKFHALLCDPPYHLTSIVKRFGGKNSAPAQFGTDGVFSRSSKGFMGNVWDGGDIAFQPETWAAMMPVLYDGAFGMAFSASRNWHRLAVAIEDAGFIIHPTIFGWLNCLSDDTEILTDKGWASIQDSIVGSRVMCYNVSDSSFQFLDFKERFEYEYQDTAYRIHSDNTDQLVTKNHRCLVERKGEFVFRLAETLEQQEVVPILEDMSFLPFPIHSSEHGRVSQKEPLFTALCNRIIQTITGRKNLETKKSETENEFGVSQRKVSKVSSMQEKVLETFGMDKEGKKSNVFQNLQRSFAGKGISKTLLQRSSCLDRNKSQGVFREDVGVEQSRLERWSNLLSQTWELFANQVREVSTRVFGYGSQGWVRDGASSYGSTGNWALPYSFRSGSPHRPQPATQLVGELHAISDQLGTQELRGTWIPTSDLARITPVEYSGKVWCVEVPTGAFVARRNGKIFVTGNSQGFPKAHRVHKEGEGVFDGHRYSLQALKPAVEPIIVFQKPYSGRPISNILETGAGTLNIDGSRIPTQDEYVINRFDDGAKPFGDGAGHSYTSVKIKEDKRLNGNGSWKTNKAAKNVYEGGYAGDDIQSSSLGRYPANFIISEENTVYLDEQSGKLSSGKMTTEHKRHTNGSPNGIYGMFDVDAPLKETIGDSGGASRFFFNVSSQIDEADPIYYCAKVGSKERSAGLDEKNIHPTLKPIDLCTYLAKLLLPPVEYAPRRIVVPFSGVASEMIGCYKAGWEEVVGIEFDKENGYIDIAEKRLEYWKSK